MGRLEEKRRKQKKRQMRVRRGIRGTAERPRLCVYRSLKHIYAQVVDDVAGKVLAATSSLSAVVGAKGKGGNLSAAEAVGRQIAATAVAKGVGKVVFDRRGYRYHGRVKSLAEAARQSGLKF